MFNVLVILLHRPFVSDGHLCSTTASVAYDSFLICASAATEIDHILRAYSKVFSMRYSPYFLSYATYVSATIHVRIAAQREPGSEAHRSLQNCLDVLTEHQSLCAAPRRAKRIIESLAKRMGVTTSTGNKGAEPPIPTLIQNRPELFGAEGSAQAPVGSNHGNVEPAQPDLDMDAIRRSFTVEHQPSHPFVYRFGPFPSAPESDPTMNINFSSTLSTIPSPHPNTPLLYDPLFGFSGPTLGSNGIGFENNIFWGEE